MSFSYEDTRDSEHLRLLTPAIDAFIAASRKPPATASTCPRQTVFFFAGGLATKLLRATEKFRAGVGKPQTFDYELVWVTEETLTHGTARHLKMHRDPSGGFRDKGDRIIVASGVIWSALYDGFIDWCANNNLDLFVFDWDWRRRLEDTGTFFVRTFLPFFRARVLAAGRPDPLATFSLIGHSFGGMIVNLILRGNDPIVANLARAVTVATPFYGYAAQVHRWFEGDPLVNGDNDIFKEEVMEVVASLPALYTLQYLDEATYNDRAIQAGLALDPEFPLTAYPSMDATTATLRADAYNPKTDGRRVRYPALTGFDRAELDYARLQAQQLAAPMPESLAEKFFNIRGVRTQSDRVTPAGSTPGNVTWSLIPASFDSTDPSPIVDGDRVPGDDTQPAWSARLATNARARCITARASDISHMVIMKHPRVLEALGSILCAPGAAMSPPVPPLPEPASDEDLVAFMRWLHAQPRRKTPWPHFDDPARRDLVPPEFREKLPAITLRIVMDLMKRPAPPGLSGRAGGGAPRTRRPGPNAASPRRRRESPAPASRPPGDGGAPGDE
ncbi:MAG: hypothetical protein WEG40_13475 [Candidatus Rokuibacteriota bacterium]